MTAGNPASFVVWVWITSAPSSNISNISNISVRGSVASASYLGSPAFSICPSASGATCKLSSLALGQVYELLASVPVATSAPLAAHVQFTAQASAKGALSFSASATDVVVAPSATAVPFSSSPVPPLPGLPPIPGTSVSPVNPADLFPTVSPSPGSGSLGLPSARSAHVAHAAETASTVPIDARLLGGQIIGLAVLAGAVTIAIARLSLRRTQPTTRTNAADQDKS